MIGLPEDVAVPPADDDAWGYDAQSSARASQFWTPLDRWWRVHRHAGPSTCRIRSPPTPALIAATTPSLCRLTGHVTTAIRRMSGATHARGAELAFELPWASTASASSGGVPASPRTRAGCSPMTTSARVPQRRQGSASRSRSATGSRSFGRGGFVETSLRPERRSCLPAVVGSEESLES